MKTLLRTCSVMMVLSVYAITLRAQEPKDDFVIVRGAMDVDVVANDELKDVRLVNISSSAHCMISIVDDRTVRIIPNIAFEGSDKFTYFALDKKNIKHNGDVYLTIFSARIDTILVYLKALSAIPDTESLTISLLLGDQIVLEKKYYIVKKSTAVRDTMLNIVVENIPSHQLGKLRLNIKRYYGDADTQWPWSISARGKFDKGKEIELLAPDSKPESVTGDKLNARWSFPALEGSEKKNVNFSAESDTDDIKSAVLVGASFDLISKLKVSNIYSSIYAFAPNLWGSFGFDAGLYQYRTIVGNNSRNPKEILYKVLGDPADSIYRSIFLDLPDSQIDNLGLFFNPAYEITDGFCLTVNFELRRQSVTITHNYTFESGDTVGHYKGFIVEESQKVFELNKPVVETTVKDLRYIGLGMILQYGNSDIDIDFSPAVLFDYKWIPTWIFPFNITGVKHDIRIGGEIRYISSGLYGKGRDYEYLIFLAKSNPVSEFLGVFDSVLSLL